MNKEEEKEEKEGTKRRRRGRERRERRRGRTDLCDLIRAADPVSARGVVERTEVGEEAVVDEERLEGGEAGQDR